MTKETDGLKPYKVRESDIYPQCGDPLKSLELIMPAFGEKLINGMIEALKEKGFNSASLKLTGLGENSQKLEIDFRNTSGQGDLAIFLTGDWGKNVEIPKGIPLLASYSGGFQRKVNRKDEKPIAVENDEIEPDQPIGVAVIGKDKWYVRLPPGDFAKGGKITKFAIETEADVIRGETVICYVEKR